MGQTASGAFDGSGTGIFAGGSQIREIVCHYDFAVQGGNGTITIGAVPKGTMIIGGYLNLITPLTGGAGSTAAVTTQAAGDIVGATLMNAAPWVAPAGKQAIKAKINTPESAVDPTMTTEETVDLVVAVNDLTAGKFDLHLIVEGAL